MVQFLYSNFLENKKIYNLAQASWKRFFDSLVLEHGISYTPYINQHSNQGKMYDGNPIFSAYFKDKNRAVRIIQIEPTEDQYEIHSWIDTFELNPNEKIDELVIDLVLSSKTKAIAEDLIYQWVMEGKHRQ